MLQGDKNHVTSRLFAYDIILLAVAALLMGFAILATSND
jgi:hypothetical protein